MALEALLAGLGAATGTLWQGDLPVRSPIDGAEIGRVATQRPEDADAAIEHAAAAFATWRSVPPPRRGELIRLFGEELRAHKDALGRVVTVETGKILQEALGEVQEMIDMCDLAVGLSRQLHGLAIASERPGHRLMETWHPLGPTVVISAFNFPVAVWAWNCTLAIVCGNPVVWKPSEKTPFSAIACRSLFERARARFGDDAPDGLLSLVVGGRDAGRRLAGNPGAGLVSATGSCAMGRDLAPLVAARFGRCLLELGGNNAMIVAPSASLDLAARAILFAAVGTAGQRCTSLRRLIVHEAVYDDLLGALKTAYASVRVGDPLDPRTLVGPLIDGGSYERMQSALAVAAGDGGHVFGGERALEETYPDGFYVRPAIVEMPEQTDIVRQETFAPILYAMRYSELPDAVGIHNAVPQGLASSIFTNDLREAEMFLGPDGSDCGIANVNIGPSGAEIGGAFGGEKETGGGREAGSDSWKNYMRRATNTINYSRDLPLAQGIVFDSSA
jgi:aldehyde dehydrogenase (NAD+)